MRAEPGPQAIPGAGGLSALWSQERGGTGDHKRGCPAPDLMLGSWAFSKWSLN